MAFGVGTPADDWTQETSNHSENKTPNSSLSDPLVNHGGYCRRWNSNSATAQVMTKYTLKDTSFANEGSKSIRGFFRMTDLHESFLSSKGTIVSPSLAIYNTIDTNLEGYTVAYGDAGDGNSDHYGLMFGYGNGIRYEVLRADNYLYTNIEANGAWIGMRLDVLKEDSDAHIKVYVVKGAVDCSTLDANGEPDWGSPIMDFIHYNGSAFVIPIVGTKLGDLPTATPLLDGRASFVFNQQYRNDYMQTFADTISFKKIDV